MSLLWPLTVLHTDCVTHVCVQHLLKDMRLFTNEAEKVNLDTSLLQGLEAVIASTIDRGLADTDYSAVHEGVTEPRK